MADSNDTDFIYLNDIMRSLSPYAKKPFTYRVYVLSSLSPNACALPGGVILLTKGLLQAMNSEAEVVSILAHEMGHIEREHCLDAVKYELLFKKLQLPTLGRLADFAVNLFLRHSFSKTQENEADEYAYEMTLQTQYDPMAVGNAFLSLKLLNTNNSTWSEERQSANIIRDYLITHPPLPLRIEKFWEKAKTWWQTHPDEKRYVGKFNLLNRRCFCNTVYQNEWVVGQIVE